MLTLPDQGMNFAMKQARTRAPLCPRMVMPLTPWPVVRGESHGLRFPARPGHVEKAQKDRGARRFRIPPLISCLSAVIGYLFRYSRDLAPTSGGSEPGGSLIVKTGKRTRQPLLPPLNPPRASTPQSGLTPTPTPPDRREIMHTDVHAIYDRSVHSSHNHLPSARTAKSPMLATM